MRLAALIVGLMGAGAAWAGELQSGLDGSDAAAGQFVYELRFAGARATAPASSFQLRLGSERQVLAQERVPFLVEYRPATDRVMLNGVDLTPMLINRQAPEEGIFSTAIGGWIPLLVVLTAATFIIVDGNQAEYAPIGTGASGN